MPGPSSFPASSAEGPAVDPASPADAGVVPASPAVAASVFGARLGIAEQYAGLLATEGVVRGLIGPRETPRLWDRHLVNCGVMAEMIPAGASVVDVGSGAGLPGLVLAIARPDLAVTLVEPLARRTSFLEEAVFVLGLDNVTVLRGRAEEVVDQLPGADVVTARAVAALDKLAGWCLPLAAVGGRLLAMKGSSAAEEIAEHAAAVEALGGGAAEIRLCGDGLIDPPTTVVEIVKERHVLPGRQRGGSGAARGASRSSRSAGTGNRGGGRGRSRRG
ncbi:16S rRNA (guanine(527)-N(7))-methyltransferase RsmG [Actinoplanes philippinensis]|uniref:16S rRNA (guanine(527)-N(7))-methyltransferase RsmG n=1 Tax=Actinoplanes philippinensis TaxID=35752 RepID=UPI000B8063EB